MPKLVTGPPKYARHKASGQAAVKMGKKLYYLGPWNSAESKVRYQAVIAEWAAQQDCAPAAAVSENLPEADTMVTEVLAAYIKHAQQYCVNKVTSNSKARFRWATENDLSRLGGPSSMPDARRIP